MSQQTTPTPGQIVYEAYCAFGARITKTHATRWNWLAPIEHAQWEAAAQAVLEAFVSSARPRLLTKETQP